MIYAILSNSYHQRQRRKKKKKIGFFFCRCSNMITEVVDEERILEVVSSMPGVVFAKPHNLLCSTAGREYIVKELENSDVDAVVVAACSPKAHEKTFMAALEKAGVNPYMLQMANIREQCAWITDDPAEATDKAEAYVRAAISRVALHEELEKREISVNPDILIVGAGVAGIEAAQTFSRAGRKVYLVERDPCIGGLVARFEEVYPSMECAPCMVAAMLQDVLQDDNIEVMTHSEISSVKGFLGNFEIEITRKARSVDEDACLGCNECIEVCPESTINEFDEGLSERKAIYVPYAGALPNVPVIDREICLRHNGEDCSLCEESCPMGAIRYEQGDRVRSVEVGGIVLATGGTLFDPARIEKLHFDEIHEVYTSMQLERIIAGNGPTDGKIVRRDGSEPKSVALLHCVGSRKPELADYCSGICCLYNLKFARNLKERLPEAEVLNFYTDLCLPGKESQKFADETLENTTLIEIQGDVELEESDSGVKIKYTTSDGSAKSRAVDMVVLAPAIVPAEGTAELAEMFDVDLDDRGFFAEDHRLINPFSSSVEGIQLAGMAQGPKGVEASIAQAAGASGRLLSALVPGRLLATESRTTIILEEVCGGCKSCVALCPYSAIDYDPEEEISRVNEVLCKGCGTCVSACPSGAARAKHFTKEQIFAEIEEVIR